MPSPSEWDFRTLTEREARRVVRYEYAREVPAFHDEVKAWHLTEFKLCIGRNYPRWARLNPGTLAGFLEDRIFDVLTAHEQFGYIPLGPFAAIMGNTPSNIYSVLGAMAWWFPEFPKPYLEVHTPAVRLERIHNIELNVDSLRQQMVWAGKPLHVESLVTDGGERFQGQGATVEVRRQEAEKGVYYLRVDFGYGIQRVKDAVEALGKKVPKAVLGKRAKQGMAASQNIHYSKLKWLATHRLAKAGLTHHQANQLCNEHMQKVLGADVHGVLPIWHSDVARFNAINDYRRHLDLLFDRTKRLAPLMDIHAFTGSPPDLW